MALDPQTHELVVIDFQEKLFGVMPEAARLRAKQCAENLTFLARELAMPVIYTEQYPQGLGHTLPSLSATDAFVKSAFAATDEDGFAARLSRKTAILLGMETHICVAHTAAGLRAAGRSVIVAPDACLSRRELDAAAGIEWMRQMGANILPSETILFGLLGRASGTLFKEVSRRIR